jgi:hypothetical protein
MYGICLLPNLLIFLIYYKQMQQQQQTTTTMKTSDEVLSSIENDSARWIASLQSQDHHSLLQIVDELSSVTATLQSLMLPPPTPFTAALLNAFSELLFVHSDAELQGIACTAFSHIARVQYIHDILQENGTLEQLQFFSHSSRHRNLTKLADVALDDIMLCFRNVSIGYNQISQTFYSQ